MARGTEKYGKAGWDRWTNPLCKPCLPHKVFAACFFGTSLQCDLCFVISILGGRALWRENISIERLKNFPFSFVWCTHFHLRYSPLAIVSWKTALLILIFSISHLLPFCLDTDLTRFCRINWSAGRLGSSWKIQSTAENAAADSGKVLHPSALELSSVPPL